MSRIITLLKKNWAFTRVRHADALSATCDETDWETVSVPHDWAIVGPFDREHDIDRQVAEEQADIEADVNSITGRTGGLPHVGEGWYRKRIEIPADRAGRCFRLECDGIMSHSTVYCNGREAGGWPYGYTSFALDITDLVEPGKTNLIAIHVDNPGKASRWYPGAGIYRHVRLVELDPVHIAHWGVNITPEVDADSGQVRIRTTVANAGPERTVLVRTVICDPEGTERGRAESRLTVPEDRLKPGHQRETGTIESEGQGSRQGSGQGLVAGKAVVDQRIDIAFPQLWSIETPCLYTAHSEVIVDGVVVDNLDTPFGFRTLRFDPDQGFFLNDQPVKFKGVCLHHDLGPLGAAVNTAAIRRQMTLLKEMGCNAIRCAHNPPAPELLDLADTMGFLVIDEAFDQWQHSKMPNGYSTLWDEWAEKDLRAMIRRDRNHPSVILWSVGNEVQDQWHADGGSNCRFLVAIAHDEDPSRLTTAAFNKPEKAIPHGLAEAVDVVGWNYYPHIYVHLRAQLPAKPMFASESCATFSSRGEYYFPVTDELNVIRESLQVNSFDLSTPSFGCSPDVEFRAQDACGFMMGEFVWSGFDYLGEPGPYMTQWPARSSYFGILDLGGLPKDRYYLYQSRWSGTDVLHLLPHWTWPGREGELIPVHCYTSYPVVELFVNGKSQGQLAHWRNRTLSTGYRFMWPAVPYQPGELKVIGYNRKREIQAERIVRTAGAPAALQIDVDRTQVSADGEDMAFATVRIVDENGVLCPRADNRITFDIDSPMELAAVCNGDATSLESFKGSTIKGFNGMCVAYLRSLDGGNGTATLTARAEGLKSGHACIALAAGAKHRQPAGKGVLPGFL